MKKLVALLLCAAALSPAQAINDPQELLEPDQAFALSLRVRDAETLEASWKIAKGYYMYRDKFKFESLDPAFVLKPAVIPAGKKKSDPTFGTVETYINAVTIRLPIGQRASGAQTVKLRISAQGCNEPIGVCYPPMVKELSVSLPPLKVAAAETKSGGVKSLKDLVGLIEPSSNQEFLPPDQAFRLVADVTDANTVTARVRIASGYYLYRDKSSAKLVRGDGLKLGKLDITRGQVKDDPYLGKTEVIHDELSIRISLERRNTSATDVELEIGYQGCAEKGICYPPATKKVSLRLPAVGADKTAITPLTSKAPTVEGDGYFSYILAAFGVGLLLTFTPCVLPMIPILSGMIVRSGDQTISKLQGGLLSYTYVLGTAATYTAAGVLAGATGGQLQAYFQNPWAIGTFAVILSFLALSMFGLFELQMPSFIQSRLHYHSHKVKGGSYIGAFFLGIVSALIVGACVSPVLLSVLGVAITTKDPVLGGGIMFAMAHGQGIILVAVGVGAGFLLPRAGAWMDRVKYVFGVMLIGVAIYLLGTLPQVPVLILWSVLLIVTAVFLSATQSLPNEASGWQYLWKGFGTFLLLWGVLALFGGLIGERDILKPVPLQNISGLTVGSPATAAPAGELFQRYTQLKEVEDALARAKREGKPALLDFYATWCTDCVRMEKTTFADHRVRAVMRNYVLIKADVTDNNDASTAIKQKFGVFGPPALLLFGANGEEKQELRFYGYRNVEEFLALLGKV
ncbi:MAG: protein-disulfide reductase DsbD [Pseudomonadota bacterium]